MVNALLMFTAAGFGFGGSPWAGFAIGASMIVLFSIPEQRDILRRYRGQPKADIVLVILLYLGLVIAGAFASAWCGYFLALLFKP
jgi:hypothetical protein